MRRVLLVSFFFPPSSVVGAVRATKLARYLPAHGWEPTVLTVDRFVSRPATLGLDEPAPRVVRARFPDPVGAILARRRTGGRPAAATAGAPGTGALGGLVTGLARNLPGVTTVHLPDRALPWYGPAVVAGLSALRHAPFDVILSTAPPPTAHLVAATLARLTGIPWVADYRDLWSGNLAATMGPVRRRVEAALERRVVAGARTLVTVSAPVAEALERLHGLPARVVTNGFDPAEGAVPALAPEGRFTLTYTGSMYAKWHDPAPLLAGIALVRDREGLTPADLRVRFYGSEHEPLPPLVERYGVSDFVRLHGLVPRAEAVARQRVADALLVLGWNTPSDQGMLTLKALEYLQARRPILLVGGGADSELSRLLTEARVGTYCGSAEEVAATLAGWIDTRRTRGRVGFTGDPEVIARYSWERLAGDFAVVLEAAAGYPDTRSE